MSIVQLHGKQFYKEYAFRDIKYKLTGRFGYIKINGEEILVGEGKSESGEITWADENGNFYVAPASVPFGAIARSISGIFLVYTE